LYILSYVEIFICCENYYAKLLFVFILTYFVFYCINFIFNLKKYKNTPYHEDITNPKNYFKIWPESATNEIKNILLNNQFETLFKIAIVWHWWEWKTTFLRKVLDEVEIQDKNIIVEFPTWQFADDKDILQSFMDEIYKSLYEQWYNFLELKFSSKYVNKLVKDSVNEWWIKNFLSLFFDLLTFFKNDDLAELLNDIQNIVGKRFIFVFDDLDRLNTDNLYTIFRLQDHLKNLNNAISFLIFERKSKVFERLEKIYWREFNEKVVNLFVYLQPQSHLIDIRWKKWWNWKQLWYADLLIEIFERNCNLVEKIESNFGKIVPERIYIIADNFKISQASTYNKIGIIRLKAFDNNKLRDIKKLLKIFFHELGHLAEKTYFYEIGKTPKELHEKISITLFLVLLIKKL